jgi:dihydroneopterin aldolase
VSSQDRILISQIDCVAVIGVTAEERALKQRLSIDVEFRLDSRIPAATDSLHDAIDYAQVAAAVSQVCTARPYHLIEALAEKIAQRVLSDFPTPSARVLIRKIAPVAEPGVAYVSIEIVRP